jgi:hypothetical protein
MLPKLGKEPKFPHTLCLISLLSSMAGKLFERVILKTVQKHREEKNLLHVGRFHACHNMTLQCLRLTDHMILNFNNNTSMAAVFLDIKKAFDTT